MRKDHLGANRRMAGAILAMVVSASLMMGCLQDPVEESPASANACLSSMTVSDGALEPSFHKDTSTYHVVTDDASFNIGADAEDTSATVTVDGIVLAPGGVSREIPLTRQSDTIRVTVTAEDDSTSKTYTLVVSYPKGKTATLRGLLLVVDTTWQSVDSLKPAFDTTRDHYKVTAHTDTIRLKPVATDTFSTITINDSVVASGTVSHAIPLHYDTNLIRIKVTAEDTGYSKIYVVEVSRCAFLQGTWNLTQKFTAGYFNGTTRSDLFMVTQKFMYDYAQLDFRFGLRAAVTFAGLGNLTNKIQGDRVLFTLRADTNSYGHQMLTLRGHVSASNPDSVHGHILSASDSLGTFAMKRTSDSLNIPTFGITTNNNLTMDGDATDWAAVDTLHIVDPKDDVAAGGSGGADIVSVKFGKNTNDGLFCFVIETAGNIDSTVTFRISLREYDVSKDSLGSGDYMVEISKDGSWSVTNASIEYLQHSNPENGKVLEGQFSPALFGGLDFTKTYLVDVNSGQYDANRREIKRYDDVKYEGLVYFK